MVFRSPRAVSSRVPPAMRGGSGGRAPGPSAVGLLHPSAVVADRQHPGLPGSRTCGCVGGEQFSLGAVEKAQGSLPLKNTDITLPTKVQLWC